MIHGARGTAAEADGPIVLCLPDRSVLLVAGLPGAGKTVLLATLDTAAGTRVFDSGSVRAAFARRLPAGTPYAVYRWWIHLLHRVAVVGACLGRRDLVVVHLPATRPRVRAALRVLARVSRRSAHLLWMDVPADVALAGQHARGRVVRPRAFAAHVAHAEAAAAALRGGHERGWRSVRLVDRAAAERGLVISPPARAGSPPGRR